MTIRSGSRSFFPTLVFSISAVACLAQGEAKSLTSHITVPEGFEIEVVAAPPLVGFPMMGCFDEKGRLFLSESAGLNMGIEELEAARPNFIRMLEDTDGDGVFDRSTIFADKLQIPNGALWHKGSLYVAEPPGIWRFTDTDGDGVADKREHIAGKVNSNGMSSTLHGPVLDPTGKLFWCGGQSGYELDDKNAALAKGRRAPGVFTLNDDGTQHEIFALGGLANPVEVAFSREGEVFGTVAILAKEDGQRRDGFMHWVYGGVYNLNGTDPVSLPRTGDYLPPLTWLGQVAPAGIARYSGTQLGSEYRDNVFFAEFNTRQVIRARLKREGATFRAETEPFLSSENIDFHATDVIEDADGSLLAIDTGGWFRHGCPTSQIAKPEVKGAIYRIRRKGASVVQDPRGLKLDWSKMNNAALCKLLEDHRPAVVELAVAELSQKGKNAIPPLRSIVEKNQNIEARRNAIWALARIGSKEAMEVLRLGLADKTASIRQSAVYAIGSLRDGGAATKLSSLVTEDPEPSIRREAATALARIGDTRAVSALLNALQGKNDPFLTHALIFALIQINDPAATKSALASENGLVQRGALLALEQMKNSKLSREEIIPLLRSGHFDVQKTAFTIASRRKDLDGEMAATLETWLGVAELSPAQEELLSRVLSVRTLSPQLEELVAQKLSDSGTSAVAQRTLLDAVVKSQKKQLPPAWVEGIEKLLLHAAPEIQLQAIELVQQRGIIAADRTLKQLANKTSASPELRMAALSALAPRLAQVEEAHLDLLKEHLKGQSPPVLRLASARTISALNLSEQQLVALADFLPQVDSLALPTLLRSFGRKTNDATGLALVTGLEKTPAAQNLGPDGVARIIAGYSSAVHGKAKPLLESLGADIAKQQQHLESLAAKLDSGDFKRGKEVFFGKKAACYSCHRISGQGGIAGPNLSKISTIRNERDLLESVVFPSASIVQGYHTFEIETKEGDEYTGIIIRETPEAVWIRGTDLAENRIETKKIKNMRESKFSIMPQGLDANLTSQELSDLIAYLQSLK